MRNQSIFKDVSFSVSHVTAALAAMIVSYGSSAVIVFQAATAMGASATEINSWFTALAIACGVSTLALSAYFRTPILIAWSTPGAALLAGMAGVGLPEAVGAFVFSAALMLLLGLTGWFAVLVRHIPATLASAMLAGILFRFGTNVFVAMDSQVWMVCLMLAAYLLSRVRLPRYSILLMLLTGFAYAALSGQMQWQQLTWQPPTLQWLSPTFQWQTLISVGIPLFLVTLATQHIPGVAVLRAHHYPVPVSPLIGVTGFVTLLLAPFGAFMTNLAAISAAICMGRDVDEEPKRRFMAALWAGLMYFGLALLGGMVVALFAAFPKALLLAVAGIAIFATLSSNLAVAMSDEATREASLVTLLASASGLNLWGISSAFWGLLLGMLVYRLNQKMQR